MVYYKINTVKNGIVTKSVFHKFPQGKTTLCPHIVEFNVDHENGKTDFGYEFMERNVFNVTQHFKDPNSENEHNIIRSFNQPVDRTTYDIPNPIPTSKTVSG